MSLLTATVRHAIDNLSPNNCSQTTQYKLHCEGWNRWLIPAHLEHLHTFLLLGMLLPNRTDILPGESWQMKLERESY